MCSMPYWSVWYDSSTHMWHDSSRRSNKNNNRTDGSFAKEPSLRLLFVWFFLHETCQICKRVIAPWPIRHATHVKVCCYTGEQMEKRFLWFLFQEPYVTCNYVAGSYVLWKAEFVRRFPEQVCVAIHIRQYMYIFHTRIYTCIQAEFVRRL